MKSLFNRLPILFLLVLPFQYANAQQIIQGTKNDSNQTTVENEGPENELDGYIKQGLQNNLVLQSRTITLDKGLLALKEARSLFQPTTWFEGQYTLAKGGRTIDIPVGTLVNPIYRTLNQLTGSEGFKSIGNVSEQFFPNNFYDVRIRTTMPLVNPGLRANRDIKAQEYQLQRNEIDLYKRELVKEIKTAYYNYLQSRQAVLIISNALDLVRQNLKVNQSLLTNGKGLPANVSRAESELNQVQSEWQNTQNEVANVKAYFNFLLNRSLTDSILAPSADRPELASLVPLQGNVARREELRNLGIASNINELQSKLDRSFRTPRINAFLDLGAQNFDFKVNDGSLFYLTGLQVQIPLFSGKRNLYRIESSNLDGKNIGLQTDQLKKQLELAALVSHNNVMNAYRTYQSSAQQVQSARQYFKLVDKGFKEGVNSLIEYLDGRTQLTNAELQVNINYYKVLVSVADYERQTSSYSLY